MPVTKEYESGFDRTFGKRKPIERGRYVWDPDKKEMVPWSEWTPKDPDWHKKPLVMTDRYMEGTYTYDTKEDISTRRKRKEYMERNNVVDPSDTVQMKAKAQKERIAYLNGENQKVIKAWREDIGRRKYELDTQKRRKNR